MPANTELLQEGRYRIAPQSANNGTVYEAYDTVGETNVLVKEIFIRTGKVTTLSQQESIRQSYAEKAKRLCSMKHDRLLRALDYFSELGRQYLVLESVEGDDFVTLLEKNQRPFALADVLRWADQMLDALNYLHNFSPQIIHKNIRPRNIRLAIDGNIKITAYGLSDENDVSLTTSLTDEGAESAVLNYSPLELIWENLDAASQKVILSGYDDRSERLLKQPPDARSDIYSVSATLYHLLTAKMPVDPLERSIEILDGKSDPLKSPDAVNSAIPPEVAEVIMRGLQIKREHRYDSASIMRQVLKTAMVRVREREEEEANDLAEAAEVLKSAKSGKLSMPHNVEESSAAQAEKPEPQPSSPDSNSVSAGAELPIDEEALEKIRQAELLERKLREAEEQRILAEKRAAEMERLLREKEAEKARLAAEAAAKAKTASLADDDLLGIISPAPAAASVPENAPVKAEKVDSKTEPKPVNVAAIQENPISSRDQEKESVIPPSEVHPQAEEKAKSVAAAEIEAEAPMPTAVQMRSQVDENGSVPESDPASGSKLPIPMIAGAAAALLVIVIGAWMFLGSSQQKETSQQPAQPKTAAESVEPAQPAQQNAFLPENQSQPDASTDTATDIRKAENESRAVAKPTPATAKPTKPTPEAQKPEQKKKVTVDDLINDN